MLGLCHICFTSGVPIFITKGIVHCSKHAEKEKEKEEEEQIRLDFEDLPQVDLETRISPIYERLSEKFEESFLEKIALDRLVENH